MGTLSEKEIFSGMFNMFDQDKDGHWSLAEIKQIFKQYATYMGRKLREPYEGWEAEVEKAVDHIDEIHGDLDGKVSFEELEKFLTEEHQDIRNLKDAVIDLSHPM